MVRAMRPARSLETSGIGPADRCEAWAGLYAILSACFSPPTEALLEDATSGDLAASLGNLHEKLPGESSRIGPAVQAFAGLTGRTTPGGPFSTLEALEVEYTRLFLGPGLPVVAPYESVYVDRENADVMGQLWGQSAFAVRDAYLEAGVAPRPGAEPPDHLPAELEFMALLWESEGAALTSGDMERAGRAKASRDSFLAGHLARWGPSMAERTAQEARHPLYEAAGQLLLAILRSDT